MHLRMCIGVGVALLTAAVDCPWVFTQAVEVLHTIFLEQRALEREGLGAKQNPSPPPPPPPPAARHAAAARAGAAGRAVAAVGGGVVAGIADGSGCTGSCPNGLTRRQRRCCWTRHSCLPAPPPAAAPRSPASPKRRGCWTRLRGGLGADTSVSDTSVSDTSVSDTQSQTLGRWCGSACLRHMHGI